MGSINQRAFGSRYEQSLASCADIVVVRANTKDAFGLN